jgi:hypothetical protein
MAIGRLESSPEGLPITADSGPVNPNEEWTMSTPRDGIARDAWQGGSRWHADPTWQGGPTATWREASLNWLALGLLLAAWNAADDTATHVRRRPEALRGYSSVSVRATHRMLSTHFRLPANS